MENYKKKYKDSLERCKREFNFNNLAYSHEEIKQRLERVFPELKESEDERIRRGLIAKLSQDEELHHKEIAWLKKQGGQVSNEPNWIHHKVNLSNCSEEYIKAYYDGWNNCNQQYSQFEAEQNPTWSEEDEDTFNDIIMCLDGNFKSDKSMINWLKSIKNRYTRKLREE